MHYLAPKDKPLGFAVKTERSVEALILAEKYG
jgi:hypothetical protein